MRTRNVKKGIRTKAMAFMMAMCLAAAVVPMSITAFASETESEHPPLSEETKEAIGAYKKNPTEENRNKVLDALNNAYDAVIDKKKENYENALADRDKSINSWMKTVISGGMPAFMSIGMNDDKGDYRAAVSKAVDTYRTKKTKQNREAVKQALTDYYDAFLAEQKYHMEETIELKDERVAASLEYFTSDSFMPATGSVEDVAMQDALAEIMCAYISVGAQIVPVNPEARVRERNFNASIKTAQIDYISNETDENLSALRAALSEAFETAYEVRVSETAQAVEKGTVGADTLFEKFLDEEFLDEQLAELNEQHNLYGRIDRIVTYGCNTYGDWEPRLKEDSQELAALLSAYNGNPTTQNKQNLENKFHELYNAVLDMETEHLDEMGPELDIHIDETLKDIIG